MAYVTSCKNGVAKEEGPSAPPIGWETRKIGKDIDRKIGRDGNMKMRRFHKICQLFTAGIRNVSWQNLEIFKFVYFVMLGEESRVHYTSLKRQNHRNRNINGRQL